MPTKQEEIEYAKSQIEIAQQGMKGTIVLDDVQHYKEMEKLWIDHYMDLVGQNDN